MVRFSLRVVNVISSFKLQINILGVSREILRLILELAVFEISKMLNERGGMIIDWL